eukprot:12989238-Heterocapsa_arctica.AAC.1
MRASNRGDGNRDLGDGRGDLAVGVLHFHRPPPMSAARERHTYHADHQHDHGDASHVNLLHAIPGRVVHVLRVVIEGSVLRKASSVESLTHLPKCRT